MRAAGEYVCACLYCAFQAIGAEGLDVGEALPPIGVVFSNGSVPSEGPGDPGEFFGVVVCHVKEMALGAFVFDRWSEGPSVAPYVEPVPPMIRGEARKCLPLLVGLSHVLFKKMLLQLTAWKAVGSGHVGGKTVDRLIEGDTGVGWAV